MAPRHNSAPGAKRRASPDGMHPRAPMAAPEVTLSEEGGVRYLHFGTPWVQGAMRIRQPYALELEYQQHMMAVGACLPEPQDILILGMGAGALAKFCWQQCPSALVRVVEYFPEVVRVAQACFALPQDARMRILIQDALTYLDSDLGCAPADWLLVDLYDGEARGPVYDDERFYARCRGVLRSPGVAAFNLFGGHFRSSWQKIAAAFSGAAIALPATDAGNRIVLAYEGDIDWMDASMDTHARQLGLRWGLPMHTWVARRQHAQAALQRRTSAKKRTDEIAV